MKAFLLAAGIGSRLGDITKHTPKCLLPIGGRPLLDYWLESLAGAGVDEVLVNLHHHADQVQEFLAARKRPPEVTTFHERELLGSAGTIAAAWDFVAGEECFFIAYADNFARVDLRRLREFHRSKGNPVLTVLAYPTTEPHRCGILELKGDGEVLTFEEKPARPRSHFASAGIHVASAELKQYLATSPPADLGFHVLPRLVGNMYGYVTDEYIQDIGSPEAYARVQELFSAKAI